MVNQEGLREHIYMYVIIIYEIIFHSIWILNNPKDIAISISLEAVELLELFQWSGSDVVCADKLER